MVSAPKRAAFTGNDRFEQEKAILVTFAGQVSVKVGGKVRTGDYIVPNGDGTGSAVDPEIITFAQYRKAVGIAWEMSDVEAVKNINVAVGVK